MDNKSTPVEVGKRMYARRKQLGITQEALADLAETTPQAISNYERGERELKAGMIVKIAEALHVSTDFLLTGVEPNRLALPEAFPETKKQQLYDILEKCIALTNADKPT